MLFTPPPRSGVRPLQGIWTSARGTGGVGTARNTRHHSWSCIQDYDREGVKGIWTHINLTLNVPLNGSRRRKGLFGFGGFPPARTFEF